MARSKSPEYDRLDDVDVYIQSVARPPEEEERLHGLLKKEIEKSLPKKVMHYPHSTRARAVNR